MKLPRYILVTVTNPKGVEVNIERKELVTCKDCKWYMNNTTVEESLESCKWRTDEHPYEDDFCSLGERREK